MTNKNYHKGRRFEYEVMDKIKAICPDAVVGRNAGSHGVFDVWAIIPSSFDPNIGELRLIQAKTFKTKNPSKQLQKEWEKMKKVKIPKTLTVSKEFWMKGLKGHIIAWGENLNGYNS